MSNMKICLNVRQPINVKLVEKIFVEVKDQFLAPIKTEF